MKTKLKLLPSLVLVSFIAFSCSNTEIENGQDLPLNLNPSDSKAVAVSSILYSWTFDEQNPYHDLEEYNSNVSIVPDPDPANPTNKVMLCSLPDGEYRAEVSVGSPKIHYFYADSINVANGDEFWIGGRMFVPVVSYVGPNTNPCIFQIGPIQNPTDYPGVTSAGHYQLQLNLTENKWRWREFESVFKPHSNTVNMVGVNFGKWETFVFHCKFKSDDSGLIEL